MKRFLRQKWCKIIRTGIVAAAQGAFKMLERLNIKREKIADIQDVIYEGDVNKDGVLDFEEWRTKMKK